MKGSVLLYGGPFFSKSSFGHPILSLFLNPSWMQKGRRYICTGGFSIFGVVLKSSFGDNFWLRRIWELKLWSAERSRRDHSAEHNFSSQPLRNQKLSPKDDFKTTPIFFCLIPFCESPSTFRRRIYVPRGTKRFSASSPRFLCSFWVLKLGTKLFLLM